MNNPDSTGYYEYNRYRNPVPKLAGLSQPASLHYGQLSMVVPVDGAIVYLAGRVVGTFPLSASTGLLAFEGWYTTPQNSSWQPYVCVPSQDSAKSRTVYGFLTRTPGTAAGNATVETALHLQTDSLYSEGSMHVLRSKHGRVPLPEGYPGPQNIPDIDFAGLFQGNSYYAGEQNHPSACTSEDTDLLVKCMIAICLSKGLECMHDCVKSMTFLLPCIIRRRKHEIFWVYRRWYV
jgi:hypothetical protein